MKLPLSLENYRYAHTEKAAYANQLLRVFGAAYPVFNAVQAGVNIGALSLGAKSKLVTAVSHFGLWAYNHDAGFSHKRVFDLLDLKHGTQADLNAVMGADTLSAKNSILVWRFKLIYYYLSLVYPDLKHLSKLDFTTLLHLTRSEREGVKQCFRELRTYPLVPMTGPVLAKATGGLFTQANLNYYCNTVGQQILGKRLTPKEIARGFLVYGCLPV